MTKEVTERWRYLDVRAALVDAMRRIGCESDPAWTRILMKGAEGERASSEALTAELEGLRAFKGSILAVSDSLSASWVERQLLDPEVARAYIRVQEEKNVRLRRVLRAAWRFADACTDVPFPGPAFEALGEFLAALNALPLDVLAAVRGGGKSGGKESPE